jgi:CBS domain-containing protein
MQLRKIMNKAVIWCAASDTAHAAATLMKEHRVGTLPVLDDPDSRKVIGIVTDRDLCVKVVAAGLDPRFAEVRECMNRDVMTCQASAEAEAALEHMKRGRVRRLPVVNRVGTLIGIVSIDDLARSHAVSAQHLCGVLAVLAKPVAKRAARAA